MATTLSHSQRVRRAVLLHQIESAQERRRKIKAHLSRRAAGSGARGKSITRSA